MEDGHGNNGYSFKVVHSFGSSEPISNFIYDFADNDTDECLSSSCSSDGESNLTSPITTDDSDNSETNSTCASYQMDEDLSREVGGAIHDGAKFPSISAFMYSRIEKSLEEGSFLVCNLSTIMSQFCNWKEELPMVEPFYAVKCNPDPVILRLLATLGCSFDCATMGELDLIINGLGDDTSLGPRGKATQSIVYANPAKMCNMIKYAMDHDVRMTVFDGEDELRKIAGLGGQKKFDLLLRLTTDDSASVCRFSKKFGCPVAEAPKLLELAKSLGLHVAGVSFHVGSGCGDAGAYTTALDHSRMVFEAAEALNMPALSIVDIGGGFPGDSGGYGGPGMPTFQELAATIRKGISHFMMRLDRPEGSVRFIAEPGRFFVSACTTIATKVYARKGGQENYQALYVDDGVYGSFNNVVYDHATPTPQKLCSTSSPEDEKQNLIPTAVFGPTCDGLDQMCSLDSTLLPRCEIGDWLIWDNQGAYTHTASFVFNGYTHFPNKTYCIL